MQIEKIPNFKSVKNLVIELAFPTLYKNPDRVEKQYNNMISKYQDAIPVTGKIEREIKAKSESITGANIIMGDMSKAKTGMYINFIGDDKKMQFRELIAKHRTRIINSVSEMLQVKKSMKIKMRLHITYMKPVERFDGDKYWKVKPSHISNKIIHTVVNSN